MVYLFSGKMAEAQTVSRDRDREEIAREIKQIFAHIKVSAKILFNF